MSHLFGIAIESLVAMLSGMPAGVPVDQAFLDRDLWRRLPRIVAATAKFAPAPEVS